MGLAVSANFSGVPKSDSDERGFLAVQEICRPEIHREEWNSPDFVDTLL